MKIYLVGGAVRDQLLGLPIKERDWVVVGSTRENMLNLGYKQVGKDFPVFLHPKSKEEYALARTERKTKAGYAGFEFNADPSITLEEDLMRRDITINAIAQSEDKTLIDPYHGQEDLTKKILRHVSPAFSEDPVRILRIARFAARWKEFTVAIETNELMKTMVNNGEVDALTPERVWRECSRALSEKNPERFIEVLEDCSSFEKLFPIELKRKTAIQRLMKATKISESPEIRFAAWTCLLNEEQLTNLITHYKIQNHYGDLALLIVRHESLCENLNSAEAILNCFQKTDAFRRPERFEHFLSVCEAIHEKPADKKLLTTILGTLLKVKLRDLLKPGLSGEQIAEVVASDRLRIIQETLHKH